MVAQDPEATIGRLGDLVERHSVCFEVRLEEQVAHGKITKIGFELQLFGTHDHRETRLTPGCERCLQTFADLRQMAEWIMLSRRAALLLRHRTL